jgi:hypothetical protein
VEPTRRKKGRKIPDYMAKHSEDGSRTSREELAFIKAPSLSEGRKILLLYYCKVHYF